MKNETQILEEKLSETRNILLELEFLKKDIKALINTPENQHKEVLSKSRFFYRLHLNYIKLFVIDIYKLIGKDEHFNLSRTIEFCKINRRKIKWHHEISLDKLNKLSSDLEKVSNRFQEIKGLRNTRYAHSDKKKGSFDFNISLNELWEVLEGLQNVFSMLNVDFDNKQWIFSIQYNSPNFVNEIYKYRKLHDLIYKEFSEDQTTVDIDKLLKIMFSRN
ncbi:MAG: hypothetical protein ABGW91_04210 [Christiangramia sp.]